MSLLKLIIPHCARSKNTIIVGSMTAVTLIIVSELCVILYLSAKKKFLINVDGVYICDQQWIPLQGVA